jgi:maleate isomerase
MTASSGESPDCRSVQPSFETRACADIGLLALASDHAIQSEVGRLLPPDQTCLHVSRLVSSNTVNMENLAGIAEGIEAACSVLLPGSPLSVIAYGCTSGTVAAGEPRILEMLKRTKPGAAPTTPITAARAAFKALGISDLSVLTPYPREVHLAVVRHLESHVRSAYFGVSEDRSITQIDRASLESAIDELARGDSRAVFVSCTALRIVADIARLERKTGKIILTSNQALAWHCLRLSGIDRAVRDYGCLFDS